MFDIQSFYEAKSIKDAIGALISDERAQIISGGTDVLIRVREGKDAGKVLVSVHNIKEIKGVHLMENGDLWIGAGTSFSHITNNLLIQQNVPVLGEAAGTVGGPQIRNMGTIGGNICNGATSADLASTMMVLDAEIVLEGSDGQRIVPIQEFYTGPGKTVRKRTEICTHFIVRKKNFEGWHGVYIKYGKRKAMEIATLGCAVVVKLSENKKYVIDVKIGFGVAGPTPIRCKSAENMLRGIAVNDKEAVNIFAKTALSETNPRSSWRASKEFRMHLIEELAKRGFYEAVKRAGGVADA